MREAQKSDLLITVPPPSEWGRALAGTYRATRSAEPPPLPAHAHVVAAECAGRVVGCVAAERVYCVTLLHVEREWRGTNLAGALARVIERMNVEGMREQLVTTSRHVELIANRMGFVPVEGSLFRRG